MNSWAECSVSIQWPSKHSPYMESRRPPSRDFVLWEDVTLFWQKPRLLPLMLLIVSKHVSSFYFWIITACDVSLNAQRNDISKNKNNTPSGSRDWPESLSSPVILDSGLSKRLAWFQGLPLSQTSHVRSWQQRKGFTWYFRDLHIFWYFFNLLFQTKHLNKWMRLLPFNWTNLQAGPHTFKVNSQIKRRLVLCFPLALVAEVSSPRRPTHTCQELVICSLLSTPLEEFISCIT